VCIATYVGTPQPSLTRGLVVFGYHLA